MTKEQFLEKLGWSELEAKGLEADPAIHEIAKVQEAKSQSDDNTIAKVQEADTAINAEAYEIWNDILRKNCRKEDWIKKNQKQKQIQ